MSKQIFSIDEETRLDDATSLDEETTSRRYGRFSRLDAMPSVAHAVTTRVGPDFAGPAEAPEVAAATAELATAMGLREAAWCHQVHGGIVRRATAAGLVGAGDAIWTDRPGLGVLARSADCPLILLAVPPAEAGCSRRGAVGVAHASWRSTVAGIGGGLVQAMVAEAAAEPATMVAAICPSAGPCCYEVGEEVRQAALAAHGERAASWFLRRGDNLYFDLWAANCDQLCQAGLLPSHIQCADICTMCRHEIFFSHRIEGARAGRFAALIGLKS